MIPSDGMGPSLKGLYLHEDAARALVELKARTGYSVRHRCFSISLIPYRPRMAACR